MNEHPAGRRRILVVDDERIVRTMLAEILNGNGYAVVEAESADSALELLTSRIQCDLIITDIQMPGHADGLALADRVASTTPVLPVLIMTGRPDLMKRPLRSSEAFLVKPFGVDELLLKVRELDATV